jgi:hypothetical protein
MVQEAEFRKAFKYLNLVREDIREEFDLMSIQQRGMRICDFGCGNGLTTFGLAIEAEESECIGIDLFEDDEGGFSLIKLMQDIDMMNKSCSEPGQRLNRELGALCQLVASDRIPTFRVGNIVNGTNLPENLDLAYCKKILVNIHGKSYAGTEYGDRGLIKGLMNIRESLGRDGMLFVVEYDKESKIRKYLEDCQFKILVEETLL